MSKGDSFERETCRAISLWWTDGKRDDVFWRNRTRVTSKTPNAERQLGDLSTVHTVGVPFVEVFNVEFKIGYSKTKGGKRHKIIPWDLLDLIDGKGHVFLDFWEQTQSDAELSRRMPMLIFKRDYHSPVVVMRRTDIFILDGYIGPVGCNNNLAVHNTFYNGVDYGPLDLYPFDKFFDWLQPGVVRILASRKANVQKKIVRRTKDASV